MKPKLIKLDNQGEPKAKCNNCGKEYDIYGKPAHTDLFNKIKIALINFLNYLYYSDFFIFKSAFLS